MLALNAKLVRDLWRLRGQVLAIAMVVASGVAVLVMALSTVEALRDTATAYYERYQFADVFARATRVPESVAQRIADIPGVQRVQTRIVHNAILDVDGSNEPIIGHLASIPESGQPDLNQLALRAGRWIAPGAHDEVIVNERFAEEHSLRPGDFLWAIINGRKRRLSVVGTALSPEFIYALAPSAILPDDKRFGVIWMGRPALAAAFDLDSAFNNLALTLLRDSEVTPILSAIDTLLEPYGGVSAIERSDQISHWFVMNEIAQINTISTILPGIFLCVAAFLSHMVLSRLITIERAEIGLLKAFGYTNFEIAWHYIRFVVAIALIGSIIGWLVGGLFGRYNTETYAAFFSFPILIYHPSASAFLIAGSVSIGSMLIGAMHAVRMAATLPPAEAMRPPSPALYQRSAFGGGPFTAWLDQPTRIALRQIGRWPVRAGISCAGIALSVALLIMALQWDDSIDYISTTFFFEAQHQHMTVGLVEPQGMRIARQFEHLPGVLRAEPWRSVAADFSAGTRRHRGGIVGIAPSNTLQPIHDDLGGENLPVPEDGLVLGSELAKKLDVSVGDNIWVEVLEGRRPAGWLPVAAVYATTIGMPATMDLAALNRWLKVGPTVQYLNLLVDSADQPALFSKLKTTPQVSSIALREAALQTFHETIAEQIMISVTIFAGFACALGFGVTYNSTRIALSERGRELATLRVLGFTRGEIAYILLGEVALLVVVALPLGCLLGRGLSLGIARAFDTELFRMPSVVEPSTYGFSIIIALLASATSAVLVRRSIQRLDLIRVLKTRE